MPRGIRAAQTADASAARMGSPHHGSGPRGLADKRTEGPKPQLSASRQPLHAGRDACAAREPKSGDRLRWRHSSQLKRPSPGAASAFELYERYVADASEDGIGDAHRLAHAAPSGAQTNGASMSARTLAAPSHRGSLGLAHDPVCVRRSRPVARVSHDGDTHLGNRHKLPSVRARRFGPWLAAAPGGAIGHPVVTLSHAVLTDGPRRAPTDRVPCRPRPSSVTANRSRRRAPQAMTCQLAGEGNGWQRAHERGVRGPSPIDRRRARSGRIRAEPRTRRGQRRGGTRRRACGSRAAWRRRAAELYGGTGQAAAENAPAPRSSADRRRRQGRLRRPAP